MANPAEHEPAGGPEPAPGPSPPPVGADADGGDSVVRRAWAVFRGEPMLLVTFGYLFVSMVGLWESYWFYRRFDLPILEYMQSSDYFVAGLRRPEYGLALAWVLLASMASLWSDRWSRRNPERAELRRRKWWGRFLFPRRSDWWAYGRLHPETATVLVSVGMIAWVLFMLTESRAVDIQRGEGHPVRVTLAGLGAPMTNDLRLMGTSSAFVFLWDLAERRVEVLPIEGIGRIEALPPGASAPETAPSAAVGPEE